MADIAYEPVGCVDHVFISSGNTELFRYFFQTVGEVSAVETEGKLRISFSWVVGKQTHQGDLRMSGFGFSQGDGCDTVKSSVATYIEVPNIFVQDQMRD